MQILQLFFKSLTIISSTTTSVGKNISRLQQTVLPQMQGKINGVVSKIKDVSPDCISIHCVIHREALVAKKLKGTINNESSAVFQSFLGDVISMVNYIRGRAKKTQDVHEAV